MHLWRILTSFQLYVRSAGLGTKIGNWFWNWMLDHLAFSWKSRGGKGGGVVGLIIKRAHKPTSSFSPRRPRKKRARWVNARALQKVYHGVMPNDVRIDVARCFGCHRRRARCSTSNDKFPGRNTVPASPLTRFVFVTTVYFCKFTDQPSSSISILLDHQLLYTWIRKTWTHIVTQISYRRIKLRFRLFDCGSNRVTVTALRNFVPDGLTRTYPVVVKPSSSFGRAVVTLRSPGRSHVRPGLPALNWIRKDPNGGSIWRH